MVDCEKFTEILAAGEEASPEERDAAREHADVCEECRRVGEAFAGFEGAMLEAEAAPPGFEGRVVARLPLDRKARGALPPLGQINWTPTWIAGGVAYAVAALFGVVVSYFALTDPAALAAAVRALAEVPSVDPSAVGVVAGASAAGIAVAGYLAYYYLVPTE
jgi:hypothetical protein